jgi:tetratricopeptide (TPR) repeat protein
MDNNLAEAQGLFESSIGLMRQEGNEAGIALGLLSLTRGLRAQGIKSPEEYARAQGLCAEARAVWHRRGNLYGLAEALVEEGNLARTQGEFTRAKECLEENLALRHQIGDRPGVGKALDHLGHFALETGDYVQARRYLEESLTVFNDCQWGSCSFAAEALINLAKARHGLGHAKEAESLAKQSLRLYHRRGARSGYHHCLHFLAQLAASGNPPGQMVRVARLMGAADAIRSVHGAALGEKKKADLEQLREQLMAQMGEARFTEEEQAGRSLSAEEAIALALEETE